ncbi:MAG: YkgJ family cysteine cluster protein [Syntrophales bacterium]|jgi:Fe-S-cluster containining protein|nr:YkgJ family cysteine cluster protein [Syntrophales bacterium]MCK9392864.1 YkgJ family cysteine cluster protein [Syntrophales bacterium]
MKIKPGKYLFSKIECRDYDILVPFSCRKTGSCCSVYMPRIPYEHLEILAKYLGLPTDEVIADYQLHYGKKLKGQSVRCPFLDNHNLCQIYHHSLRPWVCYLFPFSYDGEAIQSCPAQVEHRHLLDCLVAGEKEYDVYDSSFCPNLDLRPIPEERWLTILKRFQSVPSLPEMAVTFAAFNEPELMREGKAMYRSWEWI